MADERSVDEHERTLRRLRQEARARLEEIEAAEAERELAGRSLADELHEWALRGAVLAIEVANQVVRGRICHLGATVVEIDTGETRTLIGVDRILAVWDQGELGLGVSAETAPRPGPWTTGHPGSLVARLRELVGTGHEVVVGRSGAEALQGAVMAASEHHVRLLIRRTRTVVVPLNVITTLTSTTAPYVTTTP